MSRLAIVLLGLALVAPALSSQEQKKQKEEYAAVAMGTGGAVGGRSINFDFRIDRYTPDGEVDELASLLKNKGQGELRKALEKLEVGRINVVGSTGNSIAVARKRKTANGYMITLVTARTLPFAELYAQPRSVDYPFGFLRVELNEKGEGGGKLIAAAKLKFNKQKGHYELESYGGGYVNVVNVRPWN